MRLLRRADDGPWLMLLHIVIFALLLYLVCLDYAGGSIVLW